MRSQKIWTHYYRFLDLGSPKSILHFGLFVQELEKYSWHILEHPSPHVGTFLILFIDKFKTILTPSPLQIFFLWTAQKVMKIHDWKERLFGKILPYQNAGLTLLNPYLVNRQFICQK